MNSVNFGDNFAFYPGKIEIGVRPGKYLFPNKQNKTTIALKTAR